MYKKISLFFLCAWLLVVMAACDGQGSRDLRGGRQDTQDSAQQAQGDAQDTQNVQEGNPSSSENEEEERDTQEPLLGPDATDEEVLEVLSDDINIVTDEDYVEVLAALTEHTEECSGKIYQIEGIYVIEDGNPCITRTVINGEDRISSGIPLKYVTEEPEEGSWVRVTGIVNIGEIGKDRKAVLEVIVLQVLEGQGQTELSAH